MKIQKILFPSDFSTKGDEALEYAATLAETYGAKLLILHVAEPPAIYGEGNFYYGVPEPDTEAMKFMLHKIKPNNPAVSYEHRLVEGVPDMEIAELAKREHVDLIVMSSHGRTGIGRLLMGSVSENVMRHAECPVLIVKPTTKAAVPAAAGS